MSDNPKRSILLLRVAAVLALVTGSCQVSLYCYAKRHFTEILKNGSAKLFGGLVTVTEKTALVNPNLSTAVVCFMLAVVCFIAAHRWNRKNHSNP
jgi:ammonia channel protein AmtB